MLTRLRLNKKIYFALVLVLVMLFGFHLFLRNEDSKRWPQLNNDKLIEKVNYYNSLHHYQDAVDLIKAQDNESILRQSLLASEYANQSKYKESSDIYSQVEKTGQMNKDLAESAADTALRAKNSQQAIHYYSVAIDLTKNDARNPVWRADVRYYQNKIKMLSGN
jgi:tetratricopeptide (TPR) repeat protein